MGIDASMTRQVTAARIARVASHHQRGSPCYRGSLCHRNFYSNRGPCHRGSLCLRDVYGNTSRPRTLLSPQTVDLSFGRTLPPPQSWPSINVQRRMLSTGNELENNSDSPEEVEDPDSFSPHRHAGILLHPDSISRRILPGNFVKKANRRGGAQRKIYTELVHGYFWMLKDLKLSNEKPILSNSELIPEKIAQPFPKLEGLRRLDDGDKVDVPPYFVRRNRSRDAAAQCTVVGVYYQDFGYQHVKSWVDPLRVRLEGGGPDNSGAGGAPSSKSLLADRVEVVHLNISDGWLTRWMLQPLILRLMRRNTPPAEQSQTLTYFGSGNALAAFRDALRMHNMMSGYVFLVDGLGRVRFAGSGPASEDDVDRLWKFAAVLTHPQHPPHFRRGGKAWNPRGVRPKR